MPNLITNLFAGRSCFVVGPHVDGRARLLRAMVESLTKQVRVFSLESRKEIEAVFVDVGEITPQQALEILQNEPHLVLVGSMRIAHKRVLEKSFSDFAVDFFSVGFDSNGEAKLLEDIVVNAPSKKLSKPPVAWDQAADTYHPSFDDSKPQKFERVFKRVIDGPTQGNRP